MPFDPVYSSLIYGTSRLFSGSLAYDMPYHLR
jgi:hypothetical protein